MAQWDVDKCHKGIWCHHFQKINSTLKGKRRTLQLLWICSSIEINSGACKHDRTGFCFMSHSVSLHLNKWLRFQKCAMWWRERHVQAGLRADRHPPSSAASRLSEMRGRRFRKKGTGCVLSRGAAERWPLSRVTDYRSLMLPRRLPWLAEMNHPSAFSCKPSITSDFSLQTPAPHPVYTHTHLHTLAADTAARSHSGWVLLTNQLKLRENAAPSSIPLLSISRTLLSLFFSLTPTFHFYCHFSLSLLLCHLLLPHLFFFFSLFLYISASSQSQSSSPPRSSLCHSGISVSRVSHWPSCCPAQQKKANHCWHFKRHWIKWLTVGRAWGGTICSTTSTSQKTLSFVSALLG